MGTVKEPCPTYKGSKIFTKCVEGKCNGKHKDIWDDIERIQAETPVMQAPSDYRRCKCLDIE